MEVNNFSTHQFSKAPMNFLKKQWWIFALIIIFLFSYYIRSVNIVPDRLLSFDPIFQYRFTKYVADYGQLPIWDELTYYPGREVKYEAPPLMFFLTVFFYNILKQFGFSLMTTCAHMSAIYGAMIIVPAFFLGKELSNKYGGIFAAALTGTAPQILVRTFGSSYDTDQIALFFILLTLYLGYRFLKSPNIFNLSLALIGFIAFELAWGFVSYTLTILFGYTIILLLLNIFIGKAEYKINFIKKMKQTLQNNISIIKNIGILFVSLTIILFVVENFNLIYNIFSIFIFSQTPETSIVNISIAELQLFDVFNLEGWTTAMGRFGIGDPIIDNFILLTFTSLIILGIATSFKKKNLQTLSFLLIILLVSFYTTFRGIRFTEFTSALFIILIGTGFGNLIEWSFTKKDILVKSLSLGIGVCIIVTSFSIGLQLGKTLGPDINQNWDSAWNFLKTETPKSSIVGTWWDPGHMISGLAERRDYADGAHCPGDYCLYNINNRISDLGKIMATTSEDESLQLIKKYQGTSQKVYWIASDDLIGKFQWLQYFGTGCDARIEQKCPLYYYIPQSKVLPTNGNISAAYYSNILLISSPPIILPLYTENGKAALFNEVLVYNTDGKVVSIDMSKFNFESLKSSLNPILEQLGLELLDQQIQLTVWIPSHYSYITLIPPNLRNAVFTKMFFLEGEGLKNFKQVFRNEQVKIYEVI